MRTLERTEGWRPGDDPGPLRERLVADGYLYLPGFLDPAEVLAVQRELRAVLAEVGWLADADSLRVGADDLRFTAESFATVYPAVQRVESFHRLGCHPELAALTGALLAGPVFCHPARVLRLAPPTAADGGYFTRAHQDFVVQHVTTDALTLWLPLADCTARRQGLRVLPGSHWNGYLPTDASVGGARPLYLDVPWDHPDWATADFRPGDLVVFHSLTVHGGGPNTSDQLRLSADIRYQRHDDPMRAEWTHPHGWPRTPDWPELTGDWSSRAWIEVPPEVPLVPLPTGVPYADILRDLHAPPSRLLATAGAGHPDQGTRDDPDE
ncbi:phytanoyl-CoA dioxygenase family protein [Streptomyces sp. DSM 44915]|uniref:Phytanoyl-CoA dioxygenase family protein n=1 Tax=Streptomyces chisholmiae TaxID=3075540 RepID=A0ABU2JPC3_9ACTN|nr:phytanoyl-CoA dioxygenase family protein [Streptomyces sp. DSM 44915]MDT0266578.1 phytanoyl-CoA dioxygenase family protein [Streptomyces sp. DSM 44915]